MIYEAIDIWNSPSLSHHGVKGMKWGVRKSTVKRALNSLGQYHRTTAQEYKFRSDTVNDRIQDKVRSFNYNLKTNEKIMNTKGLIKKGEVFINRYLDKPIRIYGAAGSVETTRRKMYSGEKFIQSLYARKVVANVGYRK